MELFGKEVNLKAHYCALNGSKPSPVERPYVNLYVRIQDVCQAKCKFCTFTNMGTPKFNVHKFYYIISEMAKKLEIRKISFTGGEPTTDVNLLGEAVDMVKKVDKGIFTVVNTNGLHLSDCGGIPVNSWAVSRHHEDDAGNREIMGTTQVPGIEALSKLPFKSNIHLSCNLIKYYTDTASDVTNYMDHAAKAGIFDVGFVSLMPVNEYAKSNFIDFKDILVELKKNPDVCVNQNWDNGGKCHCANFLYLPKSRNGVVRAYSRHSIKTECSNGETAQLFFDGFTLRNGFTGPIIA